MTQQSPDEIREEIERTRSYLGSDVDALAEKVNPSSIAHRQTEKVRSRARGIREAVMGVADTTTTKAHGMGDTVKDTMENAGEALHDAPDLVAAKTRGNPLAAGLIAFGAGLLLSSLIPASEPEQRAATAVKEKAQPLVDQVAGAAKEVAQELKEPATEAAQTVRETAMAGAQHVREDAGYAAEDVKERAQEAKENVQRSEGTPGTTPRYPGTV